MGGERLPYAATPSRQPPLRLYVHTMHAHITKMWREARYLAAPPLQHIGSSYVAGVAEFGVIVLALHCNVPEPALSTAPRSMHHSVRKDSAVLARCQLAGRSFTLDDNPLQRDHRQACMSIVTLYEACAPDSCMRPAAGGSLGWCPGQSKTVFLVCG